MFKTVFFRLPLLFCWIACLPVQAVILDDEPPAAKTTKPKPAKKSAAELEVQRLKKELAAMKKQQQANQNEDQETTDSSIETGPNIEMVVLPSGIQMGKYEVTQGQWKAVIGSNPSYFSNCGNDCPVEKVNWDDIQQFIQRLNQMTGKSYRLPSEEEWHAACEAANYGNKYCGSDSIDAVGWYLGNSESITHLVGKRHPNAWGLYDMSGNVWEWTSSCWEGDCSRRVERGGSWGAELTYVSSRGRDKVDTSSRNADLGFRLALDR